MGQGYSPHPSLLRPSDRRPQTPTPTPSLRSQTSPSHAPSLHGRGHQPVKSPLAGLKTKKFTTTSFSYCRKRCHQLLALYCARARSKPYTPVGLRTRLGFSAIARLPFKRRAVAIGRPTPRFTGQQWGCHQSITASPPPRWRQAMYVAITKFTRVYWCASEFGLRLNGPRAMVHVHGPSPTLRSGFAQG